MRPAQATQVPTTSVEQETGLGTAAVIADGFEASADRSVNKLAEGRAVFGATAMTVDTSGGRTVKGSKGDDSIGRTVKGSKGDDSIGRSKGDDSIGRSKGDDSIGRSKGDDSIGGTLVAPGDDPVRDALVGPDTDASRNALRAQVYNSLENPSYATQLPPGDPRATGLLQQNLATFAKTLPAEQQTQFNAVTAKLDEPGLRLMGALVEQDPELLQDRDANGGTLVSNLARLATGKLTSSLAGDVNAKDLIDSTLRDVVNPNRVNQGDAPTCTVTSVQFELVADSPSEYTRLMADLATTGSAKMRGGGTMQLDAGSGNAAVLEGRSVTDAVFQSASMEYANGKDNFDPKSGLSTNTTTGAQYMGIRPAQQATLLEKLFNVKYSTKNLYSEAQGQEMLTSLEGWNAADHPNRPIILHLDQGKSNHAVSLESIDNGRVLFRDPYGVLRSMPEALFPKYVVAVQQPIEN